MSYNSFLIDGAREVTITVICTIPPSLHWRGGKMGHKRLTKHYLFYTSSFWGSFENTAPNDQERWITVILGKESDPKNMDIKIYLSINFNGCQMRSRSLKVYIYSVVSTWNKNLFTQSWIMIWAQPFKIIWKPALFITHHIYANT